MTKSHPVPEQQSWNPEIMNFAKLLKKAKLPEKFELLAKRGFELMEKREKRKIPAPWPTPINKLSVTSMVWNISIGQLSYQSGSAPSQLLHTCSLAEHGRLEKVLDFLATTRTISILSILVLKPKQSSYWEEN